MKELIRNPFERMQKGTVAALCVLCVLFSFSCQSKMGNSSDDPISLKGTKWKLAGIVDVETGSLKVLEPKDCMKDNRCYTLIFEKLVSDMDDNSFITYTPSNELVGIYGIDNEDQSFFIRIAGGTKVAEHWDGPLFRNCINAVQSFSLRDKELRLYYNENKNYLLFKSVYS